MIILVFLLSFVSNFLYAWYVQSIGANQMLKAALLGEAIVITGAVVVINYVKDPFYLIPMVAGGFLGTLLTNKILKLWNK